MNMYSGHGAMRKRRLEEVSRGRVMTGVGIALIAIGIAVGCWIC